MNERDTGGPAFPQSPYLDGPTQEGMTLRDYFAAKALPQLMAEGSNVDDQDIARLSYRIADAMLEARK